eukprot:256542-Rhodomonas_salina.1
MSLTQEPLAEARSVLKKVKTSREASSSEKLITLDCETTSLRRADTPSRVSVNICDTEVRRLDNIVAVLYTRLFSFSSDVQLYTRPTSACKAQKRSGASARVGTSTTRAPPSSSRASTISASPTSESRFCSAKHEA